MSSHDLQTHKQLPITSPKTLIEIRLKAHSRVWENFLMTESPLKMMKNASYFTLKALFVFKIFKYLSWLFDHVEKTAQLER